jgi:hypothetical protein
MTEPKPLPRAPRPSDKIPELPPSIGISERDMMGLGPSLWSRLKQYLADKRK